MGFRDKARKAKEDLLKGQEESYRSRDEGARNFGSIFNKDLIPEGRENWKCNKGDHLLDIIPYFTGKKHPSKPKGKQLHCLDYWYHKNVGSKNEQIPCPLKMFGKDCPICEYIEANNLSKEEWSTFKPKRKTVYLVWVHDTPQEEAKGVQIWDVAHWFMEKHLAARANRPRRGGKILFADIDEGKSVGFTTEIEGDSMNFTNHEFVDREVEIPDEIANQSFSIDEIVNWDWSYEQIKEAAFKAMPADEEPSNLLVVDKEDDIDDSQMNECPQGYEFGNFDLYEDCDDCKVRKECKETPPPAPKRRARR